MTRGEPGIATADLAEPLDLVERFSSLVPQWPESLSAAPRERKQLLCALAKRSPKRRAAHPGRRPVQE